MKRERANSEDREILLDKKIDEKVEKKLQKEKAKAEKRKNSKFRNSKFGKKWFALKKWQRVIVYVLIALLVLSAAVFGTVYSIYSGFHNQIDEGDLGISNEIAEKYGDTDIFNVALFGLDTRDEEAFTGRSDSIIIVSVDRKNNTVKLSSILRDSYVSIEGHKDQKICHAYAFGGAPLAIKTLNQNFNMNITDYVSINFAKLAQAIDLLGGVDITITEAERAHLNQIGDDDNPDFHYLDEAGPVHLTGEQAVVYARLRKIDSDVERSNRQKRVIEALLAQARKVSPSKYAELLKRGMSLCETSLSFSEIMSFAPMIKSDIQITMTNIPGEEENAVGGIYEGAWVWRYDLRKASERLHLFIYGEVPTEPVTSNSPKSDKPKNNTSDTTKPKNSNPSSTSQNTDKPNTNTPNNGNNSTPPNQNPNPGDGNTPNPPVVDPDNPNQGGEDKPENPGGDASPDNPDAGDKPEKPTEEDNKDPETPDTPQEPAA